MTVTVPRGTNGRPLYVLGRRRVWLSAIFVVAIVGAIYMGQVSQSAMIGQRVNEKQNRVSRLIKENAQLEADIAFLLAPDRIEARAKSLGLHIARPEQIKYLTIKDYPAEGLAPPGSSASSRNSSEQSEGRMSWWNDLLRVIVGSER